MHVCDPVDYFLNNFHSPKLVILSSLILSIEINLKEMLVYLLFNASVNNKILYHDIMRHRT